MQALHISRWDIIGGAARATYRIHNALLQMGVDSRMQVQVKASDEWRVSGPVSAQMRYAGQLKCALGRIVTGLSTEPDGGPRKGSWFPSRLAPGINASGTDIVHLHWIAEETISPRELKRIDRPLLWTLHDMWPFCGTEHYAPYDAGVRWRAGYTRANRSSAARGPDLDRHLYEIKRRAYDRQLSIVAPSAWIANCARESELLAGKPIEVIPHPQDLDRFKPLNRNHARAALGLRQDATLIAFGAISGKEDPRKGFDLLLEALKRFKNSGQAEHVQLVIFGQSAPRDPDLGVPFPVNFTGHLHDDVALALLYSACDLFVSPARQEAFGLTSAEAACCGCPVVAFEGTGTADLVDHRRTGYLARSQCTADFAEGIKWALAANRDGTLGRAARAKAEAEWSYATVGASYRSVYEAALDTYRGARGG